MDVGERQHTHTGRATKASQKQLKYKARKQTFPSALKHDSCLKTQQNPALCLPLERHAVLANR